MSISTQTPSASNTAPLVFDARLLQRYDVAGPRYTSYPTAAEFDDAFDAREYARNAAASNHAPGSQALSLYVHVPFCATVCFYCACTKVITANRARARPYLEHLHREIARQSVLYDAGREVTQLHFGGGTPTFLDAEQLRALMQALRQHFALLEDDRGEYSIEIDPRQADAETVALLRELGFNRMSVGVQDFDPHVQAAVNRHQSEEQTWRVVDAARAHGFRSVSVDLIYGLPLQTCASFARTLDAVIAQRPERLSVFNYAHLPALFKTQRQIHEADLPSAEDKLALLHLTIERLQDAGYVYIGMDHFALPDDELARAQRDGTLYRNFQGYSTHADCDLIGLGMSAISSVHECYSQNARDLESYAARLEAGELAVMRGCSLGRDDRIRRDAIGRLMCHLGIDKDSFAARWNIEFDDYFAEALAALAPMQDDGLVRLTPSSISVEPAGRLLLRNICMPFDAYLRRGAGPRRFSRAI